MSGVPACGTINRSQSRVGWVTAYPTNTSPPFLLTPDAMLAHP